MCGSGAADAALTFGIHHHQLKLQRAGKIQPPADARKYQSTTVGGSSEGSKVREEAIAHLKNLWLSPPSELLTGLSMGAVTASAFQHEGRNLLVFE